MTYTELLGYAAALCVLFTFCVRTMTTLRVFALMSNVLFVAYAYHGHLTPILLLHAALLPINALYLRASLRSARQQRLRAQCFGCLEPPGSLSGGCDLPPASGALVSIAVTAADQGT